MYCPTSKSLPLPHHIEWTFPIPTTHMNRAQLQGNPQGHLANGVIKVFVTTNRSYDSTPVATSNILVCLLESKLTHQALSNMTQLWPILVDDKPCHTCTTNQLPETKDPPSYREEHTHWHSNGCNAKRSLLTKQTTQCQAIMGFHRGGRGVGRGETEGICGGRGGSNCVWCSISDVGFGSCNFVPHVFGEL